jgi:hypothetical protein
VAKQNVKVELFYSSAWNDWTDSTRVASGIAINRGISNPGDEATPATATLTFDGRTGTLNPKNAGSSLYGLIGQNTPIRVTVGTSVRFVGEVKAWKPGKTVDWKGPGSIHGDAWVDVTAAGILARLSRGVDRVKSSLERTVIGLDPVAYWKLEDGSDASNASSALNDGNVLTVNGTAPSWASDNVLFPGSLPAAKVVDGLTVVANDVLRGRLSGLPGTAATVSLWYKATTDDTNPAHVISKDLVRLTPPPAGLANPDPYVRIGIDNDNGAYLIFDGSAYGLVTRTGAGFDGLWHHIAVQLNQSSAGHVQVNTYFDGVLEDSFDAHSPAYTLQAFTDLTVIPAEDMLFGTNSIWLAHLAVFDNVALDPADIYNAGVGYPDELAETRFTRLCTETGITSAVVGTAGASHPMGPQYPSTLLGLFSEIERTDDAQIYDARTFLGLEMRLGRSLLRQTASITLDYPSGQIAPSPPLQPVVGDEHVRNDVTAKKPNGITGRYVQLTGRLNVQDPGTATGAAGRYDTEIDVNPSGSINFSGTTTSDVIQLRDEAAWRVAKGTFDGQWYQTVTVDLDAAPSLVSTVDALDMGAMTKLSGLPLDEVPVGSVRHLIIGYTEMIGSHRRTVTLNQQPADPFDTGILGAASQAGYLDCGGSTLSGSMTSTTTSVPLTITDGCTWTHASGDYNISVDGEEMTVTAVGSVTGSFPSRSQTLTVTRSVNGIVKSHSSGAAVHVADGFVLAL